MEYLGDADRTLQFVVLYKEETSVLSPRGEAEGGAAGGCSTKFYTGELGPKVQPLTPFKYHF